MDQERHGEKTGERKGQPEKETDLEYQRGLIEKERQTEAERGRGIE